MRVPADYLQRSHPIPFLAYGPAWAPSTATVVYTFQPTGKRLGCIARISFCNAGAATQTICMRIVPPGGTITDEFYNEVDEQSGGSILSGNTLYWEPDASDKTLYLKPGDRIVLLASAANAIATRIWCQELN